MAGLTESHTIFTHDPLPDPAKYIRLLEVLDDKYSETIKVRCRLTTWRVDSAPPYHAISYTWGDAESNTIILMNDLPLRVRTNCEFVLKQAYWYKRSHSYLYRKRKSPWYEQNRATWYSKSRYLWLDAICIDQMNLEEKSQQVAMMGSIYKEASHVLACIGDHADDSLFFFQTLYGLSHYVVRPRDMIRCERFGGAGVSVRFRLLHRYSTTHRFVLALARLAVRPYFTRMWILQELQHAQHISVLCGKYVLPKDDALYLFGGLLKDLEGLDQDPQSFQIQNPPLFTLVHHRFLRRHVWHGFPHPVWYGDWIYRLPKQCTATLVMLRQNYATVKDNLFQLLKELVCRLQCQDPRDKVYGIISLIDWGDIPPLKPDYTHNDVEVATRFVESIMELGEAREIGEPIWKYLIITIKLLSLNTESRGLAEALVARRDAPKDCAQGVEMIPTGGSTRLSQQRGWRLSQEDIDKNASKLEDLQATPPKYPVKDVFFLPRWARENDWVIEVETEPAHDLWYDHFDAQHKMMPNFTPLLIMREGVNGCCNALIGYGFYSILRRFRTPWFKKEDHADVDICFDIEDAVVFFWRMKQLYEIHSDSKEWMLPFLETSVCRQHAPGSSYAVLPPNLPARTERVEPTYRSTSPVMWSPFNILKSRNVVLFDTKTRRGWLVNGHVAALQLLCAYLRNTPQPEPFDFSRLNHIDDKSLTGAYKVLSDWRNESIPIFRILKDVGTAPGHGQSSEGGQPIVEEKLLGEVMEDIYRVLLKMNPNKAFPGEVHHFFGLEITIEKHRNTVVKGWDFDRAYRNNQAKIYTHVFKEIPNWLGFVKDLPASFIFGSDLGEILQPDGYCCPYFQSLPKGENFLAVSMDMIQDLVNTWGAAEWADDTVAKLTPTLAWEHDMDLFSHLHGQGNHLDKIDSSCFPVQTTVKIRNNHNDTQKDKDLVVKSQGRLYSWKEVDAMNTPAEEKTTMTIKKSPKTGIVVFGKKPDLTRLRQLAHANAPIAVGSSPKPPTQQSQA